MNSFSFENVKNANIANFVYYGKTGMAQRTE